MNAVSPRWSLISLLALLLIPTARADEPEWSRYLSLDVEGTTHRIAGSADVQLPLAQGPNWALMGDLRLTGADDDSQQGSLGLAYRRLLGGERFLFGVNAFYDFAETAQGNDFTQGSIGLEAAWPHVRLHANGYFAGNDLESRGLPTLEEVELVGTEVMRVDTDFFEGAIDGWDAGVAVRVPFDRHQLWLRGGYRDFDRPGFTDLSGAELGFEWIGELATEGRWSGSQLVVGGLWQENGRGDDRDETVVHVGVRIPLNESAGTARRHPGEDWDVHAMQSRIRRQRAIHVGNTSVSASFALVDSLTGENVNVFFVDGSGGGDGSQDQPLTLEDALAAAGPSDVLFVLGGQGDIQLTAPFTLEANQALVGLGAGADTTGVPLPEGWNLTITADGGMPTLVQTGTGPVIELADGNFISGLELVGGENGLHGDGITDLTLSDLVIRDSTGHGVLLENFSGILETTGSLSITDVGGDGLVVSDPGSTLNLGDLTIMGTAGNGLTVTGGAADTIYHFDSVTISDTGGHGIAYFGAVSNSTVGGDFSIENTGGDGLTVLANSTVSLDVAGNASIDAVGERGIEVIGSTADFSFGSLTVENTDGADNGANRAAIHYEDASGSVAVTGDASLSNIGGDGIFTEDSVVDLSFGSLSIDDTTDAGMSFEEATDVTLTVTGHAEISNVGSDGIQVEDGGLNADLSFGSLTIDNAGSKGIELDEGQGTVTVEGHAELTNLGSHAIEVKDDSDFDLSFGSLTIDGVMGDGLGVNFDSTADITVTGDTTIRNVTGHGIHAFRGGDADLDFQGDLTIEDAGGDGIHFGDGASGEVTVGGDALIRNVDGSGLYSETYGGTVNLGFGNLVVDTTGGSGIVVIATGGAVTATGDTTLRNLGGAGIDVMSSDANLSFGNLTIDGTSGNGISSFDMRGALTVTGDALLRGAGRDGVEIANGVDAMLSFGNLTIDDPGRQGILIVDSSVDFTAGNLSIDGSGLSGIRLDFSTGDFTVGGNTLIQGSGFDGVSSVATDMALTFNNLTVDGGGGDGIAFEDGRGSFMATGTTTLSDLGGDGLSVEFDTSDITFADLNVSNATNGILLNRYRGVLDIDGGSIADVTNGIDLSYAFAGTIDNVAFGTVGDAVVRAGASVLGGTGNTATGFGQLYEDLGENDGTMTFTTPATVIGED